MENSITKITYQNGDITVTWEQPYNDVPINEIIHGFYTCLIGSTYLPCTIIDAMKDFVEECESINKD